MNFNCVALVYLLLISVLHVQSCYFAQKDVVAGCHRRRSFLWSLLDGNEE